MHVIVFKNQKRIRIIAMYRLALLSSSLILFACSGAQQKTLGSLKYSAKEEDEIAFEKLDHKEVRQEYRELLDAFEDEKLKEQIERRIADVYMLEGTHDQNTNKEKPSYYRDAIKAYKNILERYPDSPDNAEVLYQLAKAYDIEGQQQKALKMLEELTSRHPYYPNIIEAYFRMGDIYFSSQQYSKAEQAYLAVTTKELGSLNLNAYYMLSWSRYKLAEYQKAFSSFSFVLDELLKQNDSIESLSKKERPLAEDTIHSLSLTLDKIGGAATIETNQLINSKPYVWMLYSDLGDYYFDKELYEQSADTFRLFLRANPMASRAPLFHKRIIDTYIEGGFPRQALNEKEDFVNRFGIESEFHKQHGYNDTTFQEIKEYLNELASYHYNAGKKFDDLHSELRKTKNPDPKKLRLTIVDRDESFLKSADFYDQYVKTFPQDERVDEIYYLMSDALFLASKYEKAIKGYELVAYNPVGNSAKKYESNSGYAAIISYQKKIEIINQNNVDEVKLWQTNAVESMLRFANKFHADHRAPAVLTNAAEYLYGLNQYQRALDVAGSLIAGNASLDPKLKKTALGISAHSYFKLEDYANSRDSYLHQRELTEKDSEEFDIISEQIASTTYKYSEVLLSLENESEAIAELLKVKSFTPESPVRPIAQYDAVSLLLKNERWSEAITEIKELIVLYPKHELASDFPRKLAFALEANRSWTDAASAYLDLVANDNDAEIQREALFNAATMFEKANKIEKAIEHYKIYAYRHEKPFAPRMEARYKLASNYANIGETGKSLYWLRRIIAGNKEAGTAQTERSRWLAAWAHMQYGDYFASEYRKTALYLPLIKSLPKKQKKLEEASGHYQQAADFNFLEIVNESSFKIAKLYTQLASAINASSIPKNFSKEDKEKYAAILAQQAIPLKQTAIDLHSANIEHAWEGKFNVWIERSYEQLKILQPNRFDKTEYIVSYGDDIR